MMEDLFSLRFSTPKKTDPVKDIDKISYYSEKSSHESIIYSAFRSNSFDNSLNGFVLSAVKYLIDYLILLDLFSIFMRDCCYYCCLASRV